MTPEQVADLRLKHYNASVVKLRRVHDDLLVMGVRPDFPIPKHQPGQFGTLGLGNWEPRVAGAQVEILSEADLSKVVRRAYSLSFPILDDQGALFENQDIGYVEFYIALVMATNTATPPALTPRLFLLKEGDRLLLGSKITGNFVLNGVRPDDTVLFLSTGTGEAPHNYMLWHLLRTGHRGRLLAACCARFKTDFAYMATHQRLLERYPQYTYVPFTTREPENKQRKLYMQDLITSGELERLLGQTLDPARTHVFLCGNPGMIGVPEVDPATGATRYPTPTGVIELLEQRGFRCSRGKERGNVHFEKYW